jgi:hypothetical protein
MLSNPKIIARCEIDLSPGKVTVPVKAPARRAERGWGVSEWLFDMKRVLLTGRTIRHGVEPHHAMRH